MARDAKIICPLMGGEPCVEDGAIRNGELVSCRFWVTVQGIHPQSGAVVNNSDCAMCWTPVLMIENTKINRETGAALESFRNEMVNANQQSHQVLLATANLSTNLPEVL
jgi:hypothetical protein